MVFRIIPTFASEASEIGKPKSALNRLPVLEADARRGFLRTKDSWTQTHAALYNGRVDSPEVRQVRQVIVKHRLAGELDG